MASNPPPTSPPPPWLGLLGLINGYQITQAIHVASVLGIASHLKDGPRTIDELASTTGTHPQTLYRLLRALAAVGVFHEEAGRRFALTAMGDCLRPDSATPIGSWAEYVGTPYVWRTWCHLLHSVRTGENTFHALNGQDVWHYRAERPDDRATFDRAMTEMSRGSAEAVVAAYDFSAFHHVVDVGGGRGLMLSAILSAQPRMQGTLFDQPGVVAEAGAVLEARGVADRCRIVGGSFFDAVPEGGDAYVMRAIIHDWEDDEAVAILKTCRRAMRDDAKLLLIERLIAPPNEMPSSKFSDLNMLVMPGGLERTSEEFSHLLAAGGFELTCIAPAGNFNVIEACPS
ncbi:methyltransferase [Bradyrhizobium liaoningense]|uniref:methyltransferase n=1 Tax=Bradyrhizobium liaoningense TaxID=43992 RepID=UPI001BA6C3BB|nr:methyltransferase [Bradyrhizobium liaoningense]MBR0716875.1 methyltransferase [Bradyrhizobium liaoningense]